jgi:two-component system, OmpR family, phosphate regulon sensor histidine kinase PhoR
VRGRRAVRSAVHVLISMAFVMAGLTIAFYLTGLLYDRIGWRPPALAIQIINALLGLALLVLGVVITGIAFRRRHRDPFGPIIHALEQVARGDFSARLDDSYKTHGPVGGLVQTFNDTVLKLDEMEKMRQEFISNVSHEIQSPLTSIRGFACALRQDDLSAEERRHFLDIIEAESVRLSKLGANLLKLAALESEHAKFEPKPYRLDAQIRSLILACEPQWSGKGIEMDVTLDEASITADEDLLSQVWSNLIHNSIKFTPRGGSVRVALERHPERLEVSVADTGIGIAPEDVPHIFERFYKADPSRRRSEEGNGLGLSIAKKVVEMHRGAIGVRSQPGSGTTFTVALPV